MFSRKVRPPICFLAAVLLLTAAGFLLPVARLVPPGWNLLGLLVLAVGMIFTLLADRFLHLVKTTVHPSEKSPVLVVGSVYRISRNPMCLGFVLILAGMAVLLGTLSPWLVVAGFVILLQLKYICVEERMLEKQFGALYEGYCKHTRRWI